MANFLKNAALFLVSITISLLLAEAAARALFADTVLFNRFHAPVTYGKFETRRLQPGARFVHSSRDGRWLFRINRQGFRADRDYAYAKPDNVFRILVVGDSHTEGMEVGQNETFAARLDGRSCNGRTIEAINAGISGSGTSEQLVFYQQEGYKYSPDAVLVGFYANDFDNNLTGFHGLDAAGNLVIAQKTHPAYSGTRILEMHNSIGLLSYLSQTSTLYSILMNTGWNLGKALVYGRHLEERVFAHRQTDPEKQDLKVRITHRLLDAFSQEAARRGAAFHVVDIPLESPNGPISSLAHYPLPHNAEWTDGVIRLTDPGSDAFVAHGQRHINAGTHGRLADAIESVVCAAPDDTGISRIPDRDAAPDTRG